MRTRRTFTPEFKLEAASLVLDQGYSISQACRALDTAQKIKLEIKLKI